MHGISPSIVTAKHGIKLGGESDFNKQLVMGKRIIFTWMYAQKLMIRLIYKLKGQLTTAIISLQKLETF